MQIENVVVDGHHMIKVSAGYGQETMTPLEVERAIKELRHAVDKARAGSQKPRKFGDH